MALLGKGAMVFWHDIGADDQDYNHWHAFEHMPERVGIEGFHRGRRYIASRGGPSYFNMYETTGPEVLTSDAYLSRLNSPTPWTSKSIPNFRNSNRSLCRIVASEGKGTGGSLMTIQLAPTAEKAESFANNLCTWLGGVVTRPGIVGAHFLTADDDASRVPTAEKSLRDAPDEVADWVILLEALNDAPLAKLRDGEFSDDALLAKGAAEVQNVAVYTLVHLLSETEL